MWRTVDQRYFRWKYSYSIDLHISGDPYSCNTAQEKGGLQWHIGNKIMLHEWNYLGEKRSTFHVT